MAADVHAVVTRLGLRRPAVVGCSMGGTIALQYALDRPEDLSRLVVVASFGWLPEEMSGSVDAQTAFIRSHTLREIAGERVGASFTEDADQAVRAWMIDMIAGGDKEGYETQARATLYFDVSDRLHRATTPSPRSRRSSTCSSPTRSEFRRILSLHGRCLHGEYDADTGGSGLRATSRGDLSGKPAPGRRWRLVGLAQRFSVSRSLVRRALTRLSEQYPGPASRRHDEQRVVLRRR